MSKKRNAPVFIHSQFRTGSTYIFQVFRRSRHDYWCYYEPLHELAFQSRENPDLLIDSITGSDVRDSRHPELEEPYFQELRDVWPAWKDHISEQVVLDSYFGSEEDDTTIAYLKSLIDASRARPIIQECRTPLRIHLIKEALGGIHAYLWRNPWDQWWSYQLNDYFPAMNQMILNSSSCPNLLIRLREEIGFQGCPSNGWREQYDWFVKRPLNPEDSYILFYSLWLLGLQQALDYSDVLINIDLLSDKQDYRKTIKSRLSGLGVRGLDFADCMIPQAVFVDGDRAFFERLENKVHEHFLLCGLSRTAIDTLIRYQRSHEPGVREVKKESLDPACVLRDAERARGLCRSIDERRIKANQELQKESEEVQLNLRWELEKSQDTARERSQRVEKAEARKERERQRAERAEAKTRQLNAEVSRLEARAVKSGKQVEKAKARATEEQQRAEMAEAEASQIRGELSRLEVRIAEFREQAGKAEEEARLEKQWAQLAYSRARIESKRAADADARLGEEIRRTEAAELSTLEVKNQLGSVAAKLSETKARLDELSQNANSWRLQARAAEAERDDLLKSWSWRITAPVRWVAGLLLHPMPTIKHTANFLTSWFEGLSKKSAKILQKKDSDTVPRAQAPEAAKKQGGLGDKPQKHSSDTAHFKSGMVPSVDQILDMPPRARRIYKEIKALTLTHKEPGQ